MALDILQQELENYIGKKLQLKINDNRTTMLSVRWEPDCTKVSLNKMFLKAPENVMDDLACYLKRETKTMTPTVKAFIQDNLDTLDHSHLLDQSKLISQGKVYNLQDIYDRLNEEYFQNRITNLAVTWFGKHNQKNRSRVTFGLYLNHLKLIKIHRLLDSSFFPYYVIAYAIYHEMVHHVCPAYYDDKGLNQIHSREFKELERKFRQFALAQKWIRDHKIDFFQNEE